MVFFEPKIGFGFLTPGSLFVAVNRPDFFTNDFLFLGRLGKEPTMGEVIDIFPWALERRHDLEDKPASPEEILAKLLADITRAHDLILKMIPPGAKMSEEEDERHKKVRMLMSGAKKHAQKLMLQLVDSGLVDLEAVLEAWRKFGPTMSES